MALKELKDRELLDAVVNTEKFTVTCGQPDCGYTDKMPPWAVAHLVDTEMTWTCQKCGALNLIHPLSYAD